MAVLKEAADVKSVVNAQDLVKFLQSNHRLLSSLPDLKLVANLLLVMAATNAVSERSFSALKLIKTYLRSTQTQERLNNVMTLYVLKDLTDSLNMVDIANEFVSRNENRRNIFGKFSKADIMARGAQVSCGTQT